MSLNAELTAAEIRHQGNIQAIHANHDARITAARQNYEQAELAFNATRIQVGLRDPTYARWWFYWPFLLALSCLEVPVNQLAFQLYFGEGSFVSMLITFGIGAVLVFFAHMIGLTMRRFSHNAQKSTGALSSSLWLILLFLLSFVISYSLAILRQGYLEFQRQPDPTLTEMIQQGRELAAAATVVREGFIHFFLALDGWIFFFINFAVLTVGVAASFWSHDAHPDYARQHQKKQRTWKLLQRREQDLNRDLGAEQANHAARVDQIRRRYPDQAAA